MVFKMGKYVENGFISIQFYHLSFRCGRVMFMFVFIFYSSMLGSGLDIRPHEESNMFVKWMFSHEFFHACIFISRLEEIDRAGAGAEK